MGGRKRRRIVLSMPHGRYRLDALADFAAAGAVFVIDPKAAVSASGDMGWESGT